MKGDVVIVEEHHRRAAREIVNKIIGEIITKARRYVITIAGESGSGKSETGKAIMDELEVQHTQAVLLGQDDYFVLPPHSNDAKRREDPQWLGPHVEVRLDVIEQNLIDAIRGEKVIIKPLIDYDENNITQESVNLEGVKVIIAEGTYTSLLRSVDKRVFIDRTWEDTRYHRQKRNRGNEVGDPFIEKILVIEHKIIAGHKHLADIVITNNFNVIFVEQA